MIGLYPYGTVNGDQLLNVNTNWNWATMDTFATFSLGGNQIKSFAGLSADSFKVLSV